MNLTQTGIIVKKAAKLLLVLMFAYYIYLLILKPGFGSAVRKAFQKPIPANPVYGLLDPLEFVEKPVLGEAPKYTLNTKNGRLPAGFPEMVPVYRFKPASFSYLAGKNATDDAEKLGFTESDLITDLKGTVYKWRSLKSGGTLEIQIESRELKLGTALLSKSKEFPAGGMSSASAKTIATNLFKSIGRFDDGMYTSGSANVYLGKFTPAAIVETPNFAEAQIARVDFFRNIDGKPILGPDPEKGLLYAYVRKQADKTSLNNPVVEAYYWEINPDKTATYPIITVDEAWGAVKLGKGVISNITPKFFNHFSSYSAVKVENILIDNIYLAYYETPKAQKFLQPIYVFEGKYTTRGTDGGYITIYFPAITRDYTKQITETGTQTKQ